MDKRLLALLTVAGGRQLFLLASDAGAQTW